MQHLISPYADAARVQAVLDKFPRLAEFAYEFCTRFNVKMYHTSNLVAADTMRLITNNGLHAGLIQARKDSEGEYFLYQAEHIKKARSSRRSNNNARDAKTISSLLRALVQNGEIPTEEVLQEKMKGGLNYAFRQTQTNSTPRLEVSSDLAIKMCEYILNINHENLTNVREEVDTRYSEFLKKSKAVNDANANHNRFSSGAKAIGIHRPLAEGDNIFYLVADATYNNDKSYFTSPLTRYETISDVPELLSDVAIIRTYFDTHVGEYGRNDNDLSIPRMDKYYPEIDVATGYLERDMFWVLLPKTAP